MFLGAGYLMPLGSTFGSWKGLLQAMITRAESKQAIEERAEARMKKGRGPQAHADEELIKEELKRAKAVLENAGGSGANGFDLSTGFIEQAGKESLKFTGMGRQNASFMQPVEQGLRIVLERRQRVGIQNHPCPALQDRIHQRAGFTAHPQARSDHHRVEPLVRKHLRQSRGAFKTLEHDGGEMRGIHRQRPLPADPHRDRGRQAARPPAAIPPSGTLVCIVDPRFKTAV